MDLHCTVDCKLINKQEQKYLEFFEEFVYSIFSGHFAHNFCPIFNCKALFCFPILSVSGTTKSHALMSIAI